MTSDEMADDDASSLRDSAEPVAGPPLADQQMLPGRLYGLSLFDLPVRELTVDCVAERPVPLDSPARPGLAAGSLIRGAIGQPLRELSCARRLAAGTLCSLAPQDQETHGCVGGPQCRYAVLFKPKRSTAMGTPPVPWRLRHELQAGSVAAEKFRLVFTLLGADAVRSGDLLLEAVRAAGRRGLAHQERVRAGRERAARFEPSRSFAGPVVRLSEAVQDRLERWRYARRGLLTLRTPSDLRVGKTPLSPGDSIALVPLLRNAAFSLYRLAASNSGVSLADGAAEVLTMKAELEDALEAMAATWPIQSDNTLLYHASAVHRSTTQRQDLELGGVVGSAQYSGTLGPWAGLMEVAELLGVGKGVAYGAGRLRFTQLPYSITEGMT